MKTSISHLLCATALVLSAAPALADKSDRLFVDQLRDKIAVARAEPAVAQNGSAELDRAQEALKPLLDNLDENEVKAAKNITGEIEALIETARAQVKIAGLKTEIAQLQASGSSRIATAEVTAVHAQQSAALAQQSAAISKGEADRLRTELRDYKMTQTKLGATLVLRDVVFATGRSDLKPGATERLRPLANYLKANPEVRVHIDGHTDAQGSDASNQALSDRRASSVGATLAAMGLDRARIDAVGHGEAQPVAGNDTAAGRQQNRRVEVTLIGQQANIFATR
jgi:outer membrane protein OmpA-like peptidoglycan-associated protein